MATKQARELKASDRVNIPHIGCRTLTHVRRSRRYADSMQLQWAFEKYGCTCQSEPKCSDEMEIES